MAKVKVNHNGSCEGYDFQKGKTFEVSDGDLGKLQRALGDDLEVVEKGSKSNEADKADTKDAKLTNDKMVRNDKDVTTK